MENTTINNTVPIYRKVTLTIREAAEYSSIGINKIDSLLRTPNCPFVLFIGTKKAGEERGILRSSSASSW